MAERFPAQFEAAFQRAYRTAPKAPAACPWTTQFHQQQQHQQKESDNVGWAEEFKQRQTWAQEFSALNISERPVAEQWVDEFKSSFQACAAEEDEQMGLVAAGLLETLDLSDEKLAASKFVAFLRDLAKQPAPPQPSQCPLDQIGRTGADFEAWKQQYLSSIEHLTRDDEYSQSWQQMDKRWDSYQAHGHGYEGYAERELSNYVFSLPPAANPFNNRQEIRALIQQFVAANDLRNGILACEAAVQRDPEDAQAWWQLGVLQQLNEMDVQAISALLKASKLGVDEALIPLAASCTNESCVPDALDALQAWITKHLGIPQAAVQSPSRLACLIRELSLALPNETYSEEGHVALSILFSLAGNQQQAIESLEEALRRQPRSLELLNRMGALLANNQEYGMALRHYDAALAISPACPRVHFNRGISLMCSKYHEEAARSFVRAIKAQLPVDVAPGTKQVVERYLNIWDTLRSNLEVSDLPNREAVLDLCASRDITGLISILNC